VAAVQEKFQDASSKDVLIIEAAVQADFPACPYCKADRPEPTAAAKAIAYPGSRGGWLVNRPGTLFLASLLPKDDLRHAEFEGIVDADIGLRLASDHAAGHASSSSAKAAAGKPSLSSSKDGTMKTKWRVEDLGENAANPKLEKYLAARRHFFSDRARRPVGDRG